MQLSELIDKSLLAELKTIELRTKRQIDSELIGRYRTAFRGTGLIFSDLREYQPGDDIKNIHWKATARTGTPYIKTFDEDRMLNIILAVDISNSTNTGGPKTKHRKALEFSALIAMLANQGEDSVGLCLFSNEVEEFIPPRKTRSQFNRIITSLLQHRNLKRSTDIGKALECMRERLKKRAIIFLTSDFYSPPFNNELSYLAYKHDVIGVLLQDNPATDLPPYAIIEFEDAESGERVALDLSSKRTLLAASKLAQQRAASLKREFTKAGAEFIQVTDNIIAPLGELMRQRTRRH